MNKIQRATNKFFNTMGTMASLYGGSGHSTLYDACYFTRAYDGLLKSINKGLQAPYESIVCFPICDDTKRIIGITICAEGSILDYYGPYQDYVYTDVKHEVYFTQSQLNYIRAHGYDKVA